MEYVKKTILRDYFHLPEQLYTSSNNLQLPHGSNGHQSHYGHPEVEFVHAVSAGDSVKFLPAV